MRILFINHTFPGLFAPLAAAFGAESRHEVLFASSYGRQDLTIPGVRKIRLGSNEARARTAAAEMENMLTAGRQALHSFEKLKETGFVPDMVLSSASGGYALFWETAFPDSFRVSWTESVPVMPDSRSASEPAFVRHLAQCRQAMGSTLSVCLTAGEQGFLSKRLRHAVELPYAVDTSRFVGGRFDPQIQNDLNVTEVPELLVLAVTRTQISSPELVQVLLHLCAVRPQCHVVLFCDSMATLNQMRTCCSELPDPLAGRLHVSGMLSLNRYRTLMTMASAVVFPPGSRIQDLTLLEAMSCGAVLVLAKGCSAASFLQHGDNVFLLGEQSAPDFVHALEALLKERELVRSVRIRARQTIVEHFALEKMLPLYVHFLEEMYTIWKEQGAAALPKALSEARLPRLF